MQWHLEVIAAQVTPGAPAVILPNQTGWHSTLKLDVSENITLMQLPPRSPELIPAENIWQSMRANWLSNRISKSQANIADQSCFAWNRLIHKPWNIMSIAARTWANARSATQVGASHCQTLSLARTLFAHRCQGQNP